MRVLHLPKNQLMLVAGLVWCAAGAWVCVVGLPLQARLAPDRLVIVPLSVVIFGLFHFLVFSPIVRMHTGRIRARAENRLPVWQCFTPTGWAVMAVMMAGGMTLRLSGVMPAWVIAFFYSGLGVALFLSGLLFLRVFVRKDVLTPLPDRADR